MDAIEKKIITIIDEKREQIIAFAKDIEAHAELGYKEVRTAQKIADFFKEQGLEVKEQLAVTGVKAYLNRGKKEGVTLALIGELDALRIAGKIRHSCGHHAQLAGIMGAAMALTTPEVADALEGGLVFFAVPAEEYGEIAFKNQLSQEGKIRYGGGKCELIRIGAFNDIDLSLAHHSINGDTVTFSQGGNNGFVSKVITYHGKAAHAAGSPEKGINGLNAASLGLAALGYHRETFRDADHVRIHPIITKGGELVNVIPEEVVVETLVRASNQEAIEDAAHKTDRAFVAGGQALGARVTIETRPGYLPTIPQRPTEGLVEIARLAAGDSYKVVVQDNINQISGSSTDVGDLQHIRPVYTFATGGVEGNFHSADFKVVDEELAYIVTAKLFALGAYHLLKDQAKEARQIVANYKPPYDQDSYIEFMERMISNQTYAFSSLKSPFE